MVFPLLRDYNNPRFDTIGEALEFLRQIFEGLYFMHQCHVAHRACGNVIRCDFLLITRGLPKSQLRSQLEPNTTRVGYYFLKRHIKHYISTFFYILLGEDPMPFPSPS
ncbi:hypothetical protein ABKN59_011982 [Abortiporus biennis]